MNYINTFLLCCLLMSAGACSKQEGSLPESVADLENVTIYPAGEAPKYTVELTPEQKFGSGDDLVIGELADVAVDDQGRVYIADGDQSAILVFDEAGRLIKKLGREGRGPGEFRALKKLDFRNKQIFAFDPALDRSVIFSTDSLKHLKTAVLAGNRNDIDALRGAFLESYKVKGTGELLVKFTNQDFSQKGKWDTFFKTEYYYPQDENGKLGPEEMLKLRSANSVIVPMGPRLIGYSLDFFGTALRVLSKDNYLYTTSPPHFLVTVYGPEGNYTRSFYYPFEGVPITSENAIKSGISDHIVDNMSNIELPSTWPAINDMIIDDEQRLWISTIVDNFDIYEWWVLEKTGELIAKFNWPRSKSIQEIKGNFLYALEEDSVTNIKSVVKYRYATE